LLSARDGPENISRSRRFAIGVIKSKGVSSVAQKNAGTELEHPRGVRLPAHDN
jgi:hypothetical protein